MFLRFSLPPPPLPPPGTWRVVSLGDSRHVRVEEAFRERAGSGDVLDHSLLAGERTLPTMRSVAWPDWCLGTHARVGPNAWVSNHTGSISITQRCITYTPSLGSIPSNPHFPPHPAVTPQVSSTAHMPVMFVGFVVYLNICYWSLGLPAETSKYLIFGGVILVTTLIGYSLAQMLSAAAATPQARSKSGGCVGTCQCR